MKKDEKKTLLQLKQSIYQKKYYRDNKERLLKQNKEWLANPENKKQHLETQKIWYENNYEHCKNYQKIYRRGEAFCPSP